MIQFHLKAALLAAAMLVPLAGNAQGTTSTLNTVKSTGTLQCGVIREEEDYSKADVHGNRAAFDIDICKAVAAAVIGEKAKTVFQSFPDEPKAIEALRAGKIQLIATATTSLINQGALGAGFSPVVLFDGEGFLVLKSSGIHTPKDLAGKKVCFIDQTSNVENLTAWAAREGVKLIPFPFEEQGEMEAAMYTGNCAAVTTDITQLANTRARFNTRAKEFEILPQTISQDPLAVAYLQGDAPWGAAVTATVSAVLQAEESGVTMANVDQQRNNTGAGVDPAVRAYFATNSGLGGMLHLDPDWAVRAIKAVGNYGELYERDLGSKSPLQLPRGQSNLWNAGGLLYAPPLGSK
jgi:general L-amino acid transport system substrate-binding protein